MPRGMHVYTCQGCGKQDTCGDCIPQYCPECDRKYRANHPGDGCPCYNCVMRANDRSISLKLAEELKRTRDAIEGAAKAYCLRCGWGEKPYRDFFGDWKHSDSGTVKVPSEDCKAALLWDVLEPKR